MAATTTKKTTTPKLILTPYQVIVRPLVTEKGTHQSTRNRYTFQVHPQATKDDIRSAVQELFNVKVVAVATQNRSGKARRSRFKRGETKGWKKAIVKLDAENQLEFF